MPCTLTANTSGKRHTQTQGFQRKGGDLCSWRLTWRPYMRLQSSARSPRGSPQSTSHPATSVTPCLSPARIVVVLKTPHRRIAKRPRPKDSAPERRRGTQPTRPSTRASTRWSGSRGLVSVTWQLERGNDAEDDDLLRVLGPRTQSSVIYRSPSEATARD